MKMQEMNELQLFQHHLQSEGVQCKTQRRKSLQRLSFAGLCILAPLRFNSCTRFAISYFILYLWYGRIVRYREYLDKFKV